MLGRFFSALFVSFLIVTASAYAASSQILPSETAVPLRVRALQSEMVVAALNCNLQEQYGVFIKNHASVYKKNGASLQKIYGSNEKKLNALITWLANYASTASSSLRPSLYCGEQKKLLEKLATIDSSTVEIMADAKYADLVFPKNVLPASVSTKKKDKAEKVATKEKKSKK